MPETCQAHQELTIVSGYIVLECFIAFQHTYIHTYIEALERNSRAAGNGSVSPGQACCRGYKSQDRMLILTKIININFYTVPYVYLLL